MKLSEFLTESMDQVTVKVEIFDKSDLPDWKKEFPAIKFGPIRSNGSSPQSKMTVTGSKKDLIKLITGTLGQDKKETKEMYPELFTK